MTFISVTFISIVIAALGLICLWFANESDMHWSLFLILKIFGGALVVGAIYFWIARYEAMRPVLIRAQAVPPRADQLPVSRDSNPSKKPPSLPRAKASFLRGELSGSGTAVFIWRNFVRRIIERLINVSDDHPKSLDPTSP